MHAPVISPESRAKQADQLAKSVDWQEHTIHTHPFVLKAYGSRVRSQILTIYIEGDGLAWIAEDMPSDNPTPLVATALKMAVRDEKNAFCRGGPVCPPGLYSNARRADTQVHPYMQTSIAYLARPCQFVFHNEWANCRAEYWTHARFSPEVISAMNQAVDYLKKYYHAKKIILIGYSGGGTIAALIAARRSDVKKLITVAAVLDLKKWVAQKSLTPLYGSLDPADAWKNLVSIPQTHWVGEKDTVVPKEVTLAFANRFPAGKKPEIRVMPGFDHTCCWG